MEQQDLHYKIGLSLLHGIGPRKAALLLSKVGSAEAVFRERISALHLETGISRNLLRSMNRDAALKEGALHAEYAIKKGIQTHFFLDQNYPRRLRHIADPPIILYSKGNLDPNPLRTMAVVGTRNATGYGRELCEELIESCKDSNIQIISGMAYGIDICAHNACVRNGISTVGVLGHGLDRIYPQVHRRTAEMMLENGGLLTEFLPGTKPDRENFPMRNRIVAGMSDATVVIESKESGGSLITAELAFDYNREVLAYPGNVGQTYSQGCNMLIQRNKAHLVCNGSQILEHMGWKPTEKKELAGTLPIFKDLNEEEQKVVEYLGQESAHVDMIAMHLRIPVSGINSLLLNMEIKGILRSRPGNQYSLVQ